MRLRVTTDELRIEGDGLGDLAEDAQAQQAQLSAAAAVVSAWCAGRAAQATRAFFDTLAWSARGAADGLEDLSRRTATAGGAYESTEQALIPGR